MKFVNSILISSFNSSIPTKSTKLKRSKLIFEQWLHEQIREVIDSPQGEYIRERCDERAKKRFGNWSPKRGSLSYFVYDLGCNSSISYLALRNSYYIGWVSINSFLLRWNFLTFDSLIQHPIQKNSIKSGHLLISRLSAVFLADSESSQTCAAFCLKFHCRRKYNHC